MPGEPGTLARAGAALAVVTKSYEGPGTWIVGSEDPTWSDLPSVNLDTANEPLCWL
jgi:hypothetical protein